MADCHSCGKPLVSTNPRAKFCPGSACRVRAHTARKQGLPASVSALPVSAPAEAVDSCHAAVLAELTSAGRESTAMGRACLALAARIDAKADTGSALAGAVKQLEASMESATRGAQTQRTALDELRSRRDAKRGA